MDFLSHEHHWFASEFYIKQSWFVWTRMQPRLFSSEKKSNFIVDQKFVVFVCLFLVLVFFYVFFKCWFWSILNRKISIVPFTCLLSLLFFISFLISSSNKTHQRFWNFNFNSMKFLKMQLICEWNTKYWFFISSNHPYHRHKKIYSIKLLSLIIFSSSYNRKDEAVFCCSFSADTKLTT